MQQHETPWFLDILHLQRLMRVVNRVRLLVGGQERTSIAGMMQQGNAFVLASLTLKVCKLKQEARLQKEDAYASSRAS